MVGIAAFTALLSTHLAGVADAKPPLGQYWPSARRVAIERIDHSAFNQLLRKYVDADGYVNYAAWQRSGTDRRSLQQYLGQLSRADRGKSSNRAARLAFWINAYNAVTLEGILQVYPTTSIRNHTARFVGYNIWKELPLQVGDDAFSLEQIEHQILRKMREPRIHFAIVCASVGCPRLRNEAYVPDKLDQQLDDNARDFFSRSSNFRADARNRTIFVSSILDWFGSDFGSSQAAQFRYLQRYLPASARALAVDPRLTVKFLDYDWNLNDQARRQLSSRRNK